MDLELKANGQNPPPSKEERLIDMIPKLYTAYDLHIMEYLVGHFRFGS